MRFDLTHASFRVLLRASEQRLPKASSEISAAKLLVALFLEEECRAADWLSEADLSLDRFQVDFGLGEKTATLQSPISAPSFPAGNYGIPPEALPNSVREARERVEASPAGDSPPRVQTPDPDPHPEAEEHAGEEHSRESKYVREPDEWIDSSRDRSDTEDKTRRFYSVAPNYPLNLSNLNRQSQARFYLEDRAVNIGKLTRELESIFEILVSQFGKRGPDLQRIPAAGGGIATISNQAEDFRLSDRPLATEHLLLAVAMDEEDVGRWLRENGLESTRLFEKIENLTPCAGKNEATFPDEREIPSVGEYMLEDPEPNDEQADSGMNSTGAGEVSFWNSGLEDRKIARILDAAANRAREAIRVLEDYARFVLDDPDSTRRLKEFRHELRDILQPLDSKTRLHARNTANDIGREIEGKGEYRRTTAKDVLAANFARLQESLRSLEEFSKIEHPAMSRRFERLRYESYTLHKTIGFDQSNKPDSEKVDSPESRFLLNEARLYVLLDARENKEDFARMARELVQGGADIIQLRDKTADDRTLLARSSILREIIVASERRVLFVMNDRPDLAMLAGADGVHVGQTELSAQDVRTIVGPELLVGVSTHDIDQVRQAIAAGADYIGVGPVFESTTKSFHEFPGLDFLERLAGEANIPAFAIGGITPENLDRVLETRIHRIAVGGAILDADDPRQTTELLAERLRKTDFDVEK